VRGIDIARALSDGTCVALASPIPVPSCQMTSCHSIEVSPGASEHDRAKTVDLAGAIPAGSDNHCRPSLARLRRLHRDGKIIRPVIGKRRTCRFKVATRPRIALISSLWTRLESNSIRSRQLCRYPNALHTRALGQRPRRDDTIRTTASCTPRDLTTSAIYARRSCF
jgi:hypothetical protein